MTNDHQIASLLPLTDWVWRWVDCVSPLPGLCHIRTTIRACRNSFIRAAFRLFIISLSGAHVRPSVQCPIHPSIHHWTWCKLLHIWEFSAVSLLLSFDFPLLLFSVHCHFFPPGSCASGFFTPNDFCDGIAAAKIAFIHDGRCTTGTPN